jgi:hypothetical protein
MKKLITLLLSVISIAAFGQAGSLSQSVYRSRVLDSTSVTTPTGWGLLYFNAQRSTPAWLFSNDEGATWQELGSGSGGGSGTVTSVSGTTNRITVASGTTTPVIDVSATFEALLGKVAQRIDQNNAATTSAQLATTLTDETGTGTVIYSSAVTGVQDYPIPAAAMWPRATNGCAPLANFEMTTSLLNIVGLRFGLSGHEFAQCHFTLPKKWNNGTITYKLRWKPEASGTGNVRFGVQAAAYSNDDPLTGAFGTEVAVTDAFIATDDLHITTQSGALTIAGTPQDEDLIAIQINRDPDHTDDTFSNAAILLELTIYITTTAANDE